MIDSYKTIDCKFSISFRMNNFIKIFKVRLCHIYCEKLQPFSFFYIFKIFFPILKWTWYDCHDFIKCIMYLKWVWNMLHYFKYLISLPIFFLPLH